MALLRHSGIYFLARILSGAAGFAIIATYTRLLSASQFGELALALATIAFVVVIVAESAALTLLRYLPTHGQAARATTLWGLIMPTVAICAMVALLLFAAVPEHWQVPLALCFGLLASTVVHKFQLTTAQGAMRPDKYAWLGGLESVLDMSLGITLVWLGYGVAGALTGTMLATLTPVGIYWREWWVSWQLFDSALGRQMLRFGLPLALSGLFICLATFGDRWLLAAFAGVDKAGLYAAGYDLQLHLLGVPLMVMQLAGYPLVISAYSQHGTQAAQSQLRLLGTIMFLIVLPEAVGIIMTGPLLVNIFLGEEFRPLTLSLLPILVSATLFKALLFYVNYGYVLVARTRLALLSMAVAAGVDVTLCVVLIPHFGAWGAAAASLIGFGVGFTVAVAKMKQVFPFPLPDLTVVIVGFLGAAIMALLLSPFYHVTAWSTAAYIIPVAVLVYFGSVFLMLHFTGRKPLTWIRQMQNDAVSSTAPGRESPRDTI